MEAKCQEQEPQENDVDSPLSGDEATEGIYVPSPKKSRKEANKRVVTVPIGDGGRSKGEVYPPPDSWSWRKYGQKPIKGSPYPRGYYRCSSAKGCPARKQVERSRLEPIKLLITYFCEHNHPLLATTKHHHHLSTDSTSTLLPAKFPPEECAVFANQPDLEPADNGFSELAGELGWLADVGSTVMDCPTLVGPSWAHSDVEVFMPIGEEDESLYGDLGDLPESLVVLRRRGVETPCCEGTDNRNVDKFPM
ncbi:probable WRKY transcription factor 65 isoform X1 [Olea europaea subsp. europaea]|uniref:Probable WRKY transcription factor 65 isoform X1 n=1 Tax=Olea europaea subsp. europaea TaxID=158383 RepID=A0A8S0T1K1_OLEEU|nr:probable WRKY transcription factor 65 isoform X1 [Olea europaea subsp. europaea]